MEEIEELEGEMVVQEVQMEVVQGELRGLEAKLVDEIVG